MSAMFGIRRLDAAAARAHTAAQLEGVVEPDSGDRYILFDPAMRQRDRSRAGRPSLMALGVGIGESTSA
jgi:hypothetical protein